MNEWVDRWENGWPGWPDDGRASGWETEACITDICMRGHMGEWVGERGWVDRWIGEWMDRCVIV